MIHIYLTYLYPHRLHYALPILFTWELLGLTGSALGVYRRCHYATLAEQREASAFCSRVEAALAFERQRDAERALARSKSKPDDESDDAERREKEGEERDERRLSAAIQKEDEVVEKVRSGGNRPCGFGPSFDLAFQDDSS